MISMSNLQKILQMLLHTFYSNFDDEKYIGFENTLKLVILVIFNTLISKLARNEESAHF